MAEREFAMIARAVGEDPGTNKVTFEAFKKTVVMDPALVLNELHNSYSSGPVVKELFESGELENVDRFIGKGALLENAENLRISSVYIFGMYGKPEWLHLYINDKKLRNMVECKRDFKF